MGQKKLSVVIVSYNGMGILNDCLKSIYLYNDIGNELEVIVVDNSPEDSVYNFVRNHFPQVNIFKNKNKGFGEGNNVGAKKSSGKYLLFLNPDTILVEPIFRFALDRFEENECLAVFGVKLIDANRKRNMSFYFIDRNGFIANQFIKIANRIDLFIDGAMFISGADIFIRKSVFFSAGMFDENIFLYHEEPDLFRRVKELRLKTSYFKSKHIIHLEGKTCDNDVVKITRRLESLKYYCNKYNMSFTKQIKNEIRYNYIKLIIYRVLGIKKQETVKSNLSVLRDFIEDEQL